MPYQIHPLREFLVHPALPPSLSRLSELGYNLLWSWDHSIRALFRRLDPTLWKELNHNPDRAAGTGFPGEAGQGGGRPAIYFALPARL